MAAATICDGARAMYDALPAEVRPSERRFLDARGIARDPPHVQLDALRRYAAMDKTWAKFNKDLGYMGCVLQARGAPTTPQPPRAAPRRAVITPPPIPSLPPAAASATDSDEAWLAKIRGAATSHEISALEALRSRPLVTRNEVFQLVVRAVCRTKTVPALVQYATQLVDSLEGARRQTFEDLKKVPDLLSRRLARFVLSPSTLGVFIHYRCARLLLRLAKRNAGLDLCGNQPVRRVRILH